MTARRRVPLERVPPGGGESEKALEELVVAGLLGDHDPKALGITPDLFYNPGHLSIVQAVLAVAGRGARPCAALVAAELEARGVALADVGGREHLDRLEVSAPAADMAGTVARLRESATRRQLLRSLDAVSARVYDLSAPLAESLDAVRAAADAAAVGVEGGLPVAMRRLADVQAEPIRWLWPDLVPAGVLTLLVGAPKAGKSTVSRALATAVTTGAGLPLVREGGKLGPRRPPAGVVLIAGEDPPAQVLRPSLEESGADLSRIVLLDGRGDPDLPAPWRLNDIEALDRAVDEVGASLVIVDPWQHFAPPGTDLHRQDEVRAVLTPLHRWAGRRGVAVLLVIHPNKAQGSDVHLRVNGSGDVVAIARSVLVCARKEGQSVLAQKASNLAPSDLPGLGYRVNEKKKRTPGGDVQATWLEWTGEASADDLLGATVVTGEEQEAKDEAVEVLREALSEGPRESAEVTRQCSKAGVSDRALRSARKVLKVERKQVRVRGGRRGEGATWWALPEHLDSLYKLNELNDQNEAPLLPELPRRSGRTPGLYDQNAEAYDQNESDPGGDPT